MKVIHIAITFNQHPNTLFIGSLILENGGVETKFKVKNPFTDEMTTVFFKKISDKRPDLVYYKEGNFQGSLLGG